MRPIRVQARQAPHGSPGAVGCKAIDRLAQAQRQGAPSYPLRSGNQVSMAQASTGYVLAQHSNRPFVTEHLPTHRVIVAERPRYLQRVAFFI